jgi:hypothetical protein
MLRPQPVSVKLGTGTNPIRDLPYECQNEQEYTKAEQNVNSEAGNPQEEPPEGPEDYQKRAKTQQNFPSHK